MDYTPADSSVHGISRQDYWSGLPCPSPGIFPTYGLPHFRQILFRLNPGSPRCSVLYTTPPFHLNASIQWDELQITGTDTPVQKEEKIGGTEELEFHKSPKNPSRHVLEAPWLGLNPTSAWEWFSMAFDFTPWALDSTLWVTLSLWKETHICSCVVCQSASCC